MLPPVLIKLHKSVFIVQDIRGASNSMKHGKEKINSFSIPLHETFRWAFESKIVFSRGFHDFKSHLHCVKSFRSCRFSLSHSSGCGAPLLTRH